MNHSIRTPLNRILPIIILLFAAYTQASATHGIATIRRIVDSLGTKNKLALSVILRHDDKIVLERHIGLRRLSPDIENTPNGVYDFGSVSKQFVAAMILQLQSQGKLNIYDKLSKYYPSLAPYADTVTLYHLLHHQSGLRDYTSTIWMKDFDETFLNSPECTDSIVYAVLKRQRGLNFSPGSKYSYSNSGYWFLEQIVEKVSGKPISEALQMMIARPLQMSSLTYTPDITSANYMQGYEHDSTEPYHMLKPRSNVKGGGGVHSTAEDMLKWIDEIKLHKVFGDKFWSQMLDQGRLSDSTRTSYACGIEIDSIEDVPCIQHSGDDPPYHSMVATFPSLNLDLVIATVSDDAIQYELTSSIVKAWTDKNAEPVQAGVVDSMSTASQPISVNIGEYTGIYELGGGKAIMAVTLEDEKVMVEQRWNGVKYEIKLWEDGYYRVPEEPMAASFAFGTDSGTTFLDIAQSGQISRGIRTAVQEAPDTLAMKITGIYASDELDTRYEIRSDTKNNLHLYVGGKDLGALSRSSKNRTYSFKGALKLEFATDTSDRTIDSFVVNHPRTKGIVMKRLN